MNIVIAGGTGLVGTAITRELINRGHSAVHLSRSAKKSDHPHIRVVSWDARSPGPWAETIDGADAVINLAAESIGAGRWTRARKARIMQSRIDINEALARAIASSSKKPPVFISASGVDFYGHVDEGDVTESHPKGTGFLADVAAAGERAAQEAEGYGTRVVTLRTALIIAAHASAFKKIALPFKLFVGGPYGSGKQWFSWIHLDDVVRGYLFALETPSLKGPVNLTSPNPLRVNDLARELGKALHRPSFLPAPAAGLKILLGEMSDLLLNGRKAVPEALTRNGFTFRFATLPETLGEVVSK